MFDFDKFYARVSRGDLPCMSFTVDESDIPRFYVDRIIGSRYNVNLGKELKTSSQDEDQPGYLDSTKHFQFFGYEEKDFGREPGEKGLDRLWLSPDTKKLVQDIRMFYKHRKWFIENGVPWRYGVLLYGRPGCGKTKLASALAEDLNIPLLSYDLSSMNNSDFAVKYKNHSDTTHGMMVLIEDIDSVFQGRENITNTDLSVGLSFDCLLNTLDGVETLGGTITIITSNNIQLLDSALVDRPGRIDRKLELGGLPRAGREWLAGRLLSKMFDKTLWQDLVDAYDDEVPGTVFQDACTRRAFDLFWKINGKDPAKV